MPAKFALVPGWVTSQRDGQRQFVDARQLARLYNLKPGTYRLVSDRPDVNAGIAQAKKQGLTVLFPRADGNYQLGGNPAQERELANRGTSNKEDQPPEVPDAEPGDNQSSYEEVPAALHVTDNEAPAAGVEKVPPEEAMPPHTQPGGHRRGRK